MKDDYTANSHNITHTFGWEGYIFELGSERVKRLNVVSALCNK